MLLNQTNSGVFLTARTFWIVTAGVLLALLKTAFLFLVLIVPLFFLGISTWIAILVQNNYAEIIVEIETNPTDSDIISAIAGVIVLTINLLIAILRFLIEAWDLILPFLYEVLDILIPAIERLITVFFGTPSLSCILAEVADVVMTALNHILIGLQMIIYGAERGIEQLGQISRARSLNSIKPFIREFIAVRNATGYLQRRKVQFAQADVSVDSDTPAQNSGTDGTCPSQSIILTVFLPIIIVLIDVISLIISFLMPMAIILFATTLVALLQILPQLLGAIGQTLQALTTNGVFGDMWTMFKEILSLFGPLWNVVCPCIAIALWLLCSFEQWFHGIMTDLYNSDIVKGTCWTVHNILNPIGLKRDVEHGLAHFVDNPREYDPLGAFDKSYEDDVANDAKYNVLFSRRVNGTLSLTITNLAMPVGKHHAYHRQTLFRPSNKRLQHEEQKRRGMHPELFAVTRARRSMKPPSEWQNALMTGVEVVAHLLPEHHKRDMLSSMTTYQMTYNSMKSPRDSIMAARVHNTYNLMSTSMSAVDSTTTTVAQVPAGPPPQNNSICYTTDQDDATYGVDDDDDITQGSGYGGQVGLVATSKGDNAPNRCKSVWAMCQCTKGNVGNPGESTWQGAKVVGQCLTKSLKQLCTDIIQLVGDFIHMIVDLVKALPQILVAVLRFANELLIDIAEFIDKIITEESPLIKSLFNTLHFLGGLEPALASLNYTDYRTMFPQHQNLATVNLAASSDQQCPNNITIIEMANDPRCPYYYCVQNNPPELCYFPNQMNPGGSASQPITPPPAYTMTREELSRSEYESLSDEERARIPDRFRVQTIRPTKHRAESHIPGRAEWQTLYQMFVNKRASLLGNNNPAYLDMVKNYHMLTQFMLKLNAQSFFSPATPYPTAGSHAYSYEPGNTLGTPATTSVSDTPVTSGANPDSTECRANASYPFQCCTSNSTIYECCRGLIGCIPPIPPGFKVQPWTGLMWLGNITEQTCSPFTAGYTQWYLYWLNGFKEVHFILQIVFSEAVYWFIKDSPSSTIAAFWQFWLGWLEFPQNQMPPYAFVCFALNLGGLLALACVFVIIALFYEGFSEWFADVADILEAFRLQSEINTQMQNQMMLMGAVQQIPTTSLFMRRESRPRTTFMRRAIRMAAARSLPIV